MKRLLISMICLVQLSYAQNTEYDNFINYSTRDGLSQNDVKSIIQDSEGYIWTATNHGLNRFDGFEFKSYIHDPKDSTTIGGDLLMDFGLDQHGNLWISGTDINLAKYDRLTDRFINYNEKTIAPHSFLSKGTKCMLVDSEGNIWLGGNEGIDKVVFDGQGNLIDVLNYRINEIDGSPVLCLFQDKYDGIWVGTRDGVLRYAGTSNAKGQFMRVNSDEIHHVNCMMDYQDGLIIVGFRNYFVTHKSLNSGSVTVQLISHSPSNEAIVSKDNKLWMASRSGLAVVPIDLSKPQRPFVFTPKPANLRSFAGESPFSIFEDRSGMIWVGSIGGGLSKYNPRSNFRHYKSTGANKSISKNVIRAVFEDSQNNLWIGTDGKGPNLHHRKNQNNYNFGWLNSSENDFFKSISNTLSINELKIGQSQYVVIGGGYDKTLRVFRYKVQNDFSFNELSIPQAPKAIFCIETAPNLIIAGSYYDGLHRYIFDDAGQLKSYKNFTFENHGSQGLLSNTIRSVKFDQDLNLWIGTNEGINKIEKKNLLLDEPTFITYQHDPSNELSISKNYILPIFVSKDNNVWIGTLGGGLNRVVKGDEPDKDQFVRYSKLDGLPSNVIKAILEDDKGNLWISSNKGISKFNPDNLAISNYGLGDGLQDLEFGELAAYRRSSGEMIFGGVNGFNAFYPNRILSDTVPPVVTLDKLHIDNQLIPIGKKINGNLVLKSRLNQTNSITLRHDQNNFEIEMAALHYVAPDQNRYKYMLEGFDKEWIVTDESNRKIRYTNLPHGDYKLLVKASNSDDIWSPVRTLEIHINTPPWLTVWAISLYALVTVFILWISRRFTLIKISSKNQMILQKKAEEMHQMKLKFFTNISHEFRTPLTLILGYAEKLNKEDVKLSEEEIKKFNQNILRNSKSLLNLVNQLLGFRKAEQGMMKLKISLGSITKYVDQLCTNFLELANRKDIDFKVTYAQHIDTWFDTEIIERVVFNLLSNAFKFTPDGGKIDVIIERKKSDIILTVADNGKGIPEEQRDKIFERFNTLDHTGKSGSGIGLSFVQSLINLHRGTIILEEKRKEGTAFIVTLPAEKSAYGPEQIIENDGREVPAQEVEWLIPEEHDEYIDQDENDDKDHTVLIVEDNEEIRHFIRDSFVHHYNVLEAREGGEGLNQCREHTVDVVITDVMMEGMNGIDFCKKLKSDDRINHIPVIMLTARDTEEDKLTGYHSGAEAYITKPFRIEELEARLKAILSTRINIIEKYRSKADLSPTEIGLTNSDKAFLERMMRHIEANISNSEFTMEELAMECGLSQHYLNKKMKALVGSTAKAFVRKMRLKRAAQLFLRKDITSVTQVMNEVGFNDPKYFRVCFKEEYGLPPKEYQMKHTR